MSVTASVFVPPLNVGVLPTVAPLDEAIVRLCCTDAAFVKLIATLPAAAETAVRSNFSWPLGSVAIDGEPPEPAADPAGAFVAVGAVAPAAGAEDEVLLELPHPASATIAALRTRIDLLNTLPPTRFGIEMGLE